MDTLVYAFVMAYDPYNDFHERDTPTWFISPDWEAATRCHDWRNYINDDLRAAWDTFTVPQKRLIARNAEEEAGREEWD